MNQLIEINTSAAGIKTVNARDLHSFLEVGKVFAAWINERIEQYGFQEGVDYTVVSNSGNNQQDDCFPISESKGRGGHNRKEYHISLDMAKELSMVERNAKGKQARQYFIECERVATSNIIAMPNFSNPAEAARAWAAEYEARQLAERTKAEIGSRREATAMNTASQAVKLVHKLEVQLDQSKQYATVKRMEMLYHGQRFNWRILRSVGDQMGIPAIDVFDANYGTVKAYHADVWREAFAVDIEQIGEAA
jgi:phage anti-repressor protein